MGHKHKTLHGPQMNTDETKRKKRTAKSAATMLSFFVALVLLCGSGCSEKPATSTAPASTAWSWTPYPAAEKMRLASLPCQVLPKASLTISAPVSGQLRL